MEADLSGRHVCKLCNKSFGCGRSLGGHMRSHLTNNLADYHHDEKGRVFEDETDLEGGNFGYGLRKNPKKTHKVEFFSEEESSHQDQCGKCNSNSEEEEVEEQDSLITDSKQKLLVMDIQSDNESEAFNKRKRSSSSSSTRRRTTTSQIIGSAANSNSSSVSEIEQEQEVAISLMLLSKDVGFNLTFSNGQNQARFSSEMFLKTKKKPKKRRKFECGICNKNFDSYQALGGHRASHKKQKGCLVESAAIEDDEEEEMVKISKGKMGKVNKLHKCPICEKVFASGQALGGHKRSHLINGSEAKNREIIQSEKQIPEIRGFLDLNLPPEPVEGETKDHNLASLSPWWVAPTQHKHESRAIVQPY